MGLSSTSFRKSASARRYSVPALAGFPVLTSIKPRLLCEFARSRRKRLTAGLSSASFCRIASALRYSASACARLPVSCNTLPRFPCDEYRPHCSGVKDSPMHGRAVLIYLVET